MDKILNKEHERFLAIMTVVYNTALLVYYLYTVNGW